MNFTSTENLTITGSKMRRIVNRAFEMGTMTADLFLCIAMLNGLSEFPHLQTIIIRDLSGSTVKTPYTSADIFNLLVSY